MAYLYEKQYSHRLELEGVVREGQFELGEGVGTQQDLALTFYDQLKTIVNVHLNNTDQYTTTHHDSITNAQEICLYH